MTLALWVAALLACAHAPRPPATPALTAIGWGALRVGMTELEAKALGFEVSPDVRYDPEGCHFIVSATQPGILAMVELGYVTRLDLAANSTIRTDRRIGLGSTEAQVVAAYGPDLVVQTHDTLREPAHILTWWTVPGKAGIRFETDEKGLVRAIQSGSDSIAYVEGCS